MFSHPRYSRTSPSWVIVLQVPAKESGVTNFFSISSFNLMFFFWSLFQILRSFCNRSPPTNLNPSIRCGIHVPDGALLYDKLFLMWGDFNDKVDELTMTMLANQVEIQRDQWQFERPTCFVYHSEHSQGKVGRLLAGAL